MTALDLTALFVVAGLLARQILNLRRNLRDSDDENEKLRKNLACVQAELAEARERATRDAGMFDAVCFELREEWAKNKELRSELSAYREEEARRDAMVLTARSLAN